MINIIHFLFLSLDLGVKYNLDMFNSVNTARNTELIFHFQCDK